MKRLFSFFLLLCCLTSGAALAFQDPFYSLTTHWRLRKTLANNGKFDDADQKLVLMMRDKLRFRLSNIPTYSLALLHESTEIYDQNPQYALKLSERAIELSPDLPEPYFFRAKLLLRYDKTDFYKAALQVSAGISALLFSIRGFPFFLDIFFGGLVTLLCALGLLIWGLSLKYGLTMLRDFSATAFPRITLACFSGIVLLALLYSGRLFGVYGPFMLGALLCFRYYSNAERLVVSAGFAFIAALPLVLWIASPLLSAGLSPYAQAYAMNRGDYTAAELKEFFSLRLEDKQLQSFIKANLFKAFEDYDGAEHRYEKLIKDPRVGKLAMLNLGNLYYQQNKTAKADALYKAIEQADDKQLLATLHFNRYLLNAKRAKLEQAKENTQELDQAKENDWNLTKIYSDAYRFSPDVPLFDARLPDNYLLDKMLQRQPARLYANWMYQLLPQGMQPIPLGDLAILALVALCCSLGFACLFFRVNRPVTCERCGTLAKGDDIITAGQKHCLPCVDAVVLKRRLPERERIANEIKSRSFVRRFFAYRLFAAIASVNFHALVQGKTGRAVLSNLFFSFCAVFAFKPLDMPAPLSFASSHLWTTLLLCSLGFAVYLTALLPGLKKGGG